MQAAGLMRRSNRSLRFSVTQERLCVLPKGAAQPCRGLCSADLGSLDRKKPSGFSSHFMDP